MCRREREGREGGRERERKGERESERVGEKKKEKRQSGLNHPVYCVGTMGQPRILDPGSFLSRFCGYVHLSFTRYNSWLKN